MREVDAGRRRRRASSCRRSCSRSKPFREPHQRHQRPACADRLRQRRHGEPQPRAPSALPAAAPPRRRAPTGTRRDGRSGRGAADRPGHAAAVARADDRGAELNCGDGLSCAYRDTISWQTRTRRCRWRTIRRSCSRSCSATATPPSRAHGCGASSRISLLDSVRGEALDAAARRCRSATATRSISTSTTSARSSGASRRRGSSCSDELASAGGADRRAGRRRRAHQADVRPAGARLAGGHHARLDAA